MTFRLIFTEQPNDQTKDVGENVFLDDLPSKYKVYLFYYSGAMPDEILEDKLRTLGSLTGQNLYINIGRLDDPNYDKIADLFGITEFPVIIITAVSTLASSIDNYLSAYVRLDCKELRRSPDRTIECVQKLFNLFVQGKVSQAIARAKWDRRAEALSRLTRLFTNALKSLKDFIAERDISVSLTEGRFELIRSGG